MSEGRKDTKGETKRHEVLCFQGNPDRGGGLGTSCMRHAKWGPQWICKCGERKACRAETECYTEQNVSCCVFDRLLSNKHNIASAGNRARVTSMATMYSTTRPLMLMTIRWRRSKSGWKEHTFLPQNTLQAISTSAYHAQIPLASSFSPSPLPIHPTTLIS